LLDVADLWPAIAGSNAPHRRSLRPGSADGNQPGRSVP
jgi:hypothetical protein